MPMPLFIKVVAFSLTVLTDNEEHCSMWAYSKAGKEGGNMREFDDDVLECFLDNQLQLFPEKVAETLDEAEDFLEDCMAVVVNSVDEVVEYFEEEGIDMEGASDEEILEAEEVFDIGDGRYLIVEG